MELNRKTLVILPYKQSSSQGNEIRLALNGWRKYCKFDYYFVVIGEFEESLRTEFPWIEFIKYPTTEKKDNQYIPHLDMQHKMMFAMERFSNEYDGFIWMVDDNYAIKPFELNDITAIHYHSLSFTGCEKCPTSFWRHDKWKTKQLLDKENLPNLNYTTHYPCYFEFKKLKEIWNKFNMMNESYVLEDIYFNYFKHEEPILDNEIRLGIWDMEIFDNEFNNAIENPNIKFMCNSEKGWSYELEEKLRELYTQ